MFHLLGDVQQWVTDDTVVAHAHWVLTGLNLALSAYLIWRVRFRAALIHVNLRIVLCCTYFTQYNMIGLGRVMDELNIWLVSRHIFSDFTSAFNNNNTSFFIHHHHYRRPEDYDNNATIAVVMASNVLCLTTKLLHDTGILLAANSDLLVLAERLFATLFPDSYEGKSSRIGVTIVGTFYLGSVVLIGGVAFYNVLAAGSFSIWTSNGSCQTSALHPRWLIAFWWWAVAASYVGSVALFYLYRYNQRQSRRCVGRAQLSTRYQFSENVRTLRAVIPAIMLNAAFFTFGLCFVLFSVLSSAAPAADLLPSSTSAVEQRKSILLPITTKYIFKFFYTFSDIYGLIFALIFIARSKSVLNMLREDFRRLGCGDRVGGGGGATGAHFLADTWSLSTSVITPHNGVVPVTTTKVPVTTIVVSSKRGRNALAVEDRRAHQARMSDKHFRQLYEMWN